jgi:hypothetical protein
MNWITGDSAFFTRNDEGYFWRVHLVMVLLHPHFGFAIRRKLTTPQMANPDCG